jgi:ribonuclease HII
MMNSNPENNLFPDFQITSTPSLALEIKYQDMGYHLVAGVDEAGRGPLAGPVVAGAVILPADISEDHPLFGARDSKTMKSEKREIMYDVIVEHALSVSWAMCENHEIDKINILQASLEAMKRAVYELRPAPDICLVDGNQVLPSKVPSVSVIKGDGKCLSIAAASIIAKVTRDHIMEGIHRLYPDYGFDLHKGYPTKAHKNAIKEHGLTPFHRLTYKGVKEFVKEV